MVARPTLTEEQLSGAHLSSAPALLHRRWHQRDSPSLETEKHTWPSSKPGNYLLIQPAKFGSSFPFTLSVLVRLFRNNLRSFPAKKLRSNTKHTWTDAASLHNFFFHIFFVLISDCWEFCPIKYWRQGQTPLISTNGDDRKAGPHEQGSAGFTFSGVFRKAESRLGSLFLRGNSANVCGICIIWRGLSFLKHLKYRTKNWQVSLVTEMSRGHLYAVCCTSLPPSGEDQLCRPSERKQD